MKSNEIPKTILKLNSLIDNIAKVLGWKNLGFECKWDEGYGDGYGFWYDKVHKYVWIGYSFNMWSESEAPFFIQVNKRANKEAYNLFDEYCNSKSRKLKINIHDNDIKFIDISDLLENSENTKIISELIIEFSNLLIK